MAHGSDFHPQPSPAGGGEYPGANPAAHPGGMSAAMLGAAGARAVAEAAAPACAWLSPARRFLARLARMVEQGQLTIRTPASRAWPTACATPRGATHARAAGATFPRITTWGMSSTPPGSTAA